MDIHHLDMEDVLSLHARQLGDFGGAPDIRDAGLIEAALARPQSGYYGDRIEEAAALWENLTMNHGSVDGNKRVGFAATCVFLRINGLVLAAPIETTLEFVIGRLETRSFMKDVLDVWLREHVREQQIR